MNKPSIFFFSNNAFSRHFLLNKLTKWHKPPLTQFLLAKNISTHFSEPAPSNGIQLEQLPIIQCRQQLHDFLRQRKNQQAGRARHFPLERVFPANAGAVDMS